MPTFVYNKCPICQSEKFSFMGNADLGTVAIHKPSNSQIVKCKICKTIFVNPMPIWNDDDFSALYKHGYFPQTERWIKKREHSIIKHRFNEIKKNLIAKNKYMLEFGAGIQAYMAKYLYDKNWDVDIQEPSCDFSELLKAQFPEISVVTTDFMKINPQKKYTLIYSDSVLEHVHNPIEYVQKCAQLLELGGILYFVSPNEHSFKNWIHSLYKKVKKKSVSYLCPYTHSYHIVGFSKKSIKILAEKSGLELVKHFKRNDYEWFHVLENKKSIFKYPMACMLYLADLLGWGTNQEIILRKNK